MKSSKLPSVLQIPGQSISMERALKQILVLLETGVEDSDQLNASIDTVGLMLNCIDRSDD